MSLTALAFLAAYCSGLLMSLFRHPRFGLYAYLIAFYLHPPDRWWRAEVPDLRYALIAAIVTLVSLTRLESDETRLRWHQTGAGKILMLYVGWMVLQSAWAITGALHAEGVELYAKYLVLFFLIYRLVDSEEEMRNFFLAHVLGAFYLGWLAYGKTVRGRLEGMGGPGIDDANTFAMHVSTAAVFGAALLLRGGRYIRLLMVPTMPFILNGMILTQSRGAFVGLVGAACAVLIFKPPERKLVFYGLGGLAVTLFLILSPPDFLERLESLRTAATNVEEADSSASSRLVIAEAQWAMAKRHPLGTGHRGTRVLSGAYLDEEYLTVNRHGEGQARSSHNTLLTVLVDQGFPGLFLWACLYIWAAKTLLSLKAMDARGLPYKLAAYRMSLAGALALIVASGLFSNYFKAEVNIWCIALVAALKQIADAHAASTEAETARSSTTSENSSVGLPEKEVWRQQQHW